MALAVAELDSLPLGEALSVGEALSLGEALSVGEALSLGLAESLGVAESVGVGVSDGDAEALLLPELPVSAGMSAAALVAQAVAASTAAMIEQASITRPWGEAIGLLHHRMCLRANPCSAISDGFLLAA